jgi:hypothetical protein
MKKLTTMFAMIAMTTALGLGGCKKTPEENKTDPVAKPAETKPDDTKKPDDPKKPDDTKKPDEVKPAAAGDLPAECADYKAAIDSLAKCDKLPQATRDALKQSYDQTSAAWASVPAEGKAALGTACKAAADAVKQSATACN